MAPDESATIDVTGTAPLFLTQDSFYAFVSAAGDTNFANDSAYVTVPVDAAVDIGIGLSAEDDPVTVGTPRPSR